MKVGALLGIFVAHRVLVDAVESEHGLPGCAVNCIEWSVRTESTCADGDMWCLCADDRLDEAMRACLARLCTLRETMSALNITTSRCQQPVRDRTHIPTIVASVTGGLAMLAVLIRTMIGLLDGQFGWHDACALGAGIWAIPMNAMQFPLSAAGFGKDIWTIPLENVTRIQKLVWSTQIFYWPTTTLSRFAFLLLYLRIFPRERFRRWVYAAMGLNFFYWSFFQFSNLFQCRPMWMVWKGWDGEHEGSCWNINKLMLSAAGYTIVLDLIVIVLPVGELLQLQLSGKRKLGIIGNFVVGTFMWIISVIKIWAISTFAESTNTTWNDVPGDYWSVMEANMSVICVCIKMSVLSFTQTGRSKPW
ncbi:hypothetical protein BKA63DRAFT_499004 [Paraphoma chrysanthemicola]|nr:hypothetical protein BKA63DRAFT_499004 [Paraphoma chrysanthemicola]